MRSTERGTVLFFGKKHKVTPPNHQIKAHLSVIKVKPSTGFWRLTIYDESSYPYVTKNTIVIKSSWPHEIMTTQKIPSYYVTLYDDN
jgi:regulation of enolase protein 1 (concanavalin A-like superfamily)